MGSARRLGPREAAVVHGSEAARGSEEGAAERAPGRGAWDVLRGVKSGVSEDNATLVAAGVAFYGLLALFPALAAVVSVYGLVADPAQVQSQVQGLTAVPEQVRQLVSEQLARVSSRSSGQLGAGLIAGLLVALWGASKAMKALMQAMNIAYGEREERGFLRLNAVALLFTAGGVVFAVLAVVVIAGAPALLGAVGDRLGLGQAGRWAAASVSWALLAAGFVAAVGAVHRWGPSRAAPRWRWVTPGSVSAALLWLLGSAAFSFYVARFGSYDKTYGSIGAIVVVLMWLWISALVIIIGAELNAVLEQRTAADTTEGELAPLGERGARAADTVGPAPR